MGESNKDTHVLAMESDIGDIKISDDAIAVIAGIAATEVDGVDSMAGGITSELIGKLGVKNLSKGVDISVEDEKVMVDISLNIKYSYNIPEVSEKVQEKVKVAIENMTGLEVTAVRIRIAGVNVPQT